MKSLKGAKTVSEFLKSAYIAQQEYNDLLTEMFTEHRQQGDTLNKFWEDAVSDFTLIRGVYDVTSSASVEETFHRLVVSRRLKVLVTLEHFSQFFPVYNKYCTFVDLYSQATSAVVSTELWKDFFSGIPGCTESIAAHVVSYADVTDLSSSVLLLSERSTKFNKHLYDEVCVKFTSNVKANKTPSKYREILDDFMFSGQYNKEQRLGMELLHDYYSYLKEE